MKAPSTIAALLAFALVPGLDPGIASPALADPVACTWVYDATRCRTADEWRAEAHTWCERAAQSTVRRQSMQRAGCAAEQAGLAKAEAATVANMEH